MNFNAGNENENENERNNYYLSNFMYEFEDNLFTNDQPENHLPFASFSSMFDNNLEFNHALELETGFDQPGSSQIIPPAQPNWFPIMEDSEEMNIAGGNSSVLGEFDNSAALISYGMNKENPIEINDDDDDSPSTGKKIMDPPLVTEGGSSGGQNEKGKESQSDNLLAERIRRAKLNKRLLSLRSVVPKITKMDQSSTLGDAIDHIKDLSDKIDKLKLELESAPSLPPAIAPTAALEEVSQHPTRIEVRKREGGIVTIHMCCSCRPGMLHSIAKTLNNLGIEIQDAVFNCHDGALILDLYRAQQINDVTEEQIKAMLLETVRDHGAV